MLELLGHGRERLALALAAGGTPFLQAELVVLGEPRRGGARELGLDVDAARTGDCAAGRCRLERHARQPLEPRDEDRGRIEDRRPRAGVARRSQVDAPGERARDRRPADQRPGAQQHHLPAGKLGERVDDRPRDDPLVRAQLDDDSLLLRLRGEERGVDARRDEVVVAGEPLLGCLADVGGERDQRVEPRQQLLALRPRRRIAEAVRRGEGRDGERVGVAQREVGERRQPRLEPVHEVVGALCERLPQVGLHADRYAELRAARDRDCRADGEHVGPLAPQQGPAAGEQVGGTGRRRHHRDLVPALPQGDRHTADVIVHVVRLRPCERRHQADPHRHRMPEPGPPSGRPGSRRG